MVICSAGDSGRAARGEGVLAVAVTVIEVSLISPRYSRVSPLFHEFRVRSAMMHRKRDTMFGWTLVALAAACLLAVPASASGERELLIRNVKIFDGHSAHLSPPSDVLVRGKLIAAIGTSLDTPPDATVVEGRGRTLIPGLIDNHVHLTFSSPRSTRNRTALCCNCCRGSLRLRS